MLSSVIESAGILRKTDNIMIIDYLHRPGQDQNKGSCSSPKFRGWSCISAKRHLKSSLIYELPKQAYQSLRDGNESLYVELVLTQIEHLKSPISLQHLRYICDSALLHP